MAFALGLGAHLKATVAIAKGLVRTMLAYDADLVEINPLAIVRTKGADGTETLSLQCLDAKVTLDDSALARHPGLEDLRDLDEEDPTDAAARAEGISFIKLDGTIGCMVNGAGLAMTTMDLVKRAGGEPANFLDIGGGARADKVSAAMRLILDDPKVTAILVNIFGGITRGDEVARGLIEARANQVRDVPMVVRIVGTNAAEAAQLLTEAHFATAASLDEAAAKAVAAAQGGGIVSILVGRETRLVVQGITGREGEFHSRAMLEYGTAIVSGVTPGKGGQMALDGRVPVFDTVADAVRETGANTTCIYVPAAGAPGRDHGGARGRDRHDLLHHRGHPRPRHAHDRRGGPPGRRPAHRPQLPRARRRPAGPRSGSSPGPSIARDPSVSCRAPGPSRTRRSRR